MLTQLQEQRLDEIQANSFKNFHVKNFHYICLKVWPSGARDKLYFFDDDFDLSKQVVSPHNHLYRFETRVLKGAMVDTRYKIAEYGEDFRAYEYYTPLSKGKGFQDTGQNCKLLIENQKALKQGNKLETDETVIHSIQIMEEGTVLKLFQHPHTRELGDYTHTYFNHENKAPEHFDGLYEKFTEFELIALLRKYSLELLLGM